MAPHSGELLEVPPIARPVLLTLPASPLPIIDGLDPTSGGGVFSWLVGPVAVLVLMPAPARVFSAVSCSPWGCAAGVSRVILNCVAVWFLLALAMGPMIGVLRGWLWPVFLSATAP